MRFLSGALVALVLVLTAGGCAKPRPCVIIPRQLDLARFEVDRLDKLVTGKAAEVTSLQGNIEMARTRLTQLEQEASELERAIEASKADSSAAGRKR